MLVALLSLVSNSTVSFLEISLHRTSKGMMDRLCLLWSRPPRTIAYQSMAALSSSQSDSVNNHAPRSSFSEISQPQLSKDKEAEVILSGRGLQKLSRTNAWLLSLLKNFLFYIRRSALLSLSGLYYVFFSSKISLSQTSKN